MAIKLAPDAFDFPEVAAPATPDTGYIRVYGKSDGKMYKKDDAGVETELGGGSGDVVGPASATDNAFARFDGTTGKLIQNSAATLDDNGAATFPRKLTINGGANEATLSVRAFAGQTAALMELANSSGIVVATMTPSGGWFLNQTDASDADLTLNDDNGDKLLFADVSAANIGIGTNAPDAATKVDIVSTDGGLGIPAMTSAQWSSVGASRDGNIAYDTDLHDFVGIKNGVSSLIGSPYVADGITFTDPTTPSWTNLNHGGGTYTEDTTNKRLTIVEDGNGSAQLRGWYTAYPGDPTVTPYALRIHAKVDAIGATNGLAIGFRQNSTQELHLYLLYDSTSPTFRIDKWNTATSFNSTYIAATTLRYIPNWFKIEDNGTNRIISTSIDGVVWSVRHSIGRTDFLTADEIFVGMIVTTNAAYDSEISILSYEVL